MPRRPHRDGIRSERRAERTEEPFEPEDVPLGQRGRDRLTNLQGMLDMAHPGHVGHHADHAVALLFGYTRRRRPEATNRPVAGRQVDVDRLRVAAGSHVPHDVVEPIDVVAVQVSDDPGEQRAVVIGVEVEQRWQ
jgi:hypothetical protein